MFLIRFSSFIWFFLSNKADPPAETCADLYILYVYRASFRFAGIHHRDAVFVTKNCSQENKVGAVTYIEPSNLTMVFWAHN